MRDFQLRVNTKRWLLGSMLVLLGLLGGLYAQISSAATYTWDNGGGDNLWSTCTNWSSDVCPGSGDIARFTSATTSDSIIDALFAGSVLGIDIDVGYTGTITQERNLTIGSSSFVQDDGTFNQGATTFDINDGSFTVNGGAFTTATGTSNVERNFTIDASATYTSSSTKVWNFDGPNSNDNTNFNYSGTFPSVVSITKTSNSANFTLVSGVISSVDNMLSSTQILINDGTILNVADNPLSAFNLTISGQLFASTTVNLSGSFTLNATGEFYYDGSTVNIERSYTDNGGTFDESGITFVFDGGNSDDDTTFTHTGVFPGIVDIDQGSGGGSFTLASGVIINMLDMSTNVGFVVINNGATMHVANNPLAASNLTISGQLFASTTVNLSGSFTLNATGEFYYDGSTVNIERSYTDNGGTFDESGITFVFDGGNSDDDTTFTHTGVFPGIVDIDQGSGGGSFTLASGVIINMLDMSTNVGFVVINNGATMHVANNPLAASNLTISGQLFASSTVDLSGSFTLNSSGALYYDGSTMTIKRNYTDNGGTFDGTGVTVVFDGPLTTDDSTFTATGVFAGDVVIAKDLFGADFTLNPGASVFVATSITSGDIYINGVMSTAGNTLTAAAIIVGSTGTLRLYGNESVTPPTLSPGSTVDYYGPSTYTSIGDYNYQNLAFSDGTYNLTSNISVAGNFTNSAAVFNQTAGTTTFTGTANTILGNNTFNNLTKSAAAASTLTFGAGDTQTVLGNLTLTGLDAGNRLTLASTVGSSQWFIDPQGSRMLNYLILSDGNNTNSTAVNCYDVDCVDGGNNTNIFFVPPFPTYRLNGGVRLRGGVRI